MQDYFDYWEFKDGIEIHTKCNVASFTHAVHALLEPHGDKNQGYFV